MRSINCYHGRTLSLVLTNRHPARHRWLMFAPDGKIGSHAEHERLLRLRAREEAGALFRAHGDAALAVAYQTRTAIENDARERRQHRLVIAEVERLDREARRSTALALYRGPTIWSRLRAILAGK